MLRVHAAHRFSESHDAGCWDKVSVEGVDPRELEACSEVAGHPLPSQLGREGADGLQQTQVVIGVAIRSHVDRYSFSLVLPQCREGRAWSDNDMMQLAFAAPKAATKEFQGDADLSDGFLSGRVRDVGDCVALSAQVCRNRAHLWRHPLARLQRHS
jgi:hypothetical protein